LGAGGLEFKSPRPDQSTQQVITFLAQKPRLSVAAEVCPNVAGCAQLHARSLQKSLHALMRAGKLSRVVLRPSCAQIISLGGQV